MMIAVYDKRDKVAMFATLLLLLLGAAAQGMLVVRHPVSDTAIQVSLIGERPHSPDPVQASAPAMPVQKTLPRENTLPHETNVPVDDASSQQPLSSQPAAAETASALAQPVNAAHAVTGEDTLYVGKLRNYLRAIKRYPTSREARLQRPVGEVEVWFVLSRDGRMLDVGIERSSHSLILDSAALSTVRSGVYPAFSDALWAGDDSHRFTVVLEYTI